MSSPADAVAGAAAGSAFGPWGAAIGGGIGFLGGLFSNRAASAQSQRQMDFQERMSSTAHQREVKDLRAAGLNPILSANKGASTPGGSAAPVRNVGAEAVHSAFQAQQMVNLKAQTALTAAGVKKTLAEAHHIENEANKGDFYSYLWGNAKDAQQGIIPSALEGWEQWGVDKEKSARFSKKYTQGSGTKTKRNKRTFSPSKHRTKKSKQYSGRGKTWKTYSGRGKSWANPASRATDRNIRRKSSVYDGLWN